MSPLFLLLQRNSLTRMTLSSVSLPLLRLGRLDQASNLKGLPINKIMEERKDNSWYSVHYIDTNKYPKIIKDITEIKFPYLQKIFLYENKILFY